MYVEQGIPGNNGSVCNKYICIHIKYICILSSRRLPVQPGRGCVLLIRLAVYSCICAVCAVYVQCVHVL